MQFRIGSFLIAFTFVVIITAYLFEEAFSKEYKFKPRDTFNTSHWNWKKKLWRKTIDKVERVNKIKNPFPKMPKIRPRRIIKGEETGKHRDPCRMVKDLCINGGICKSIGDEWFCDCPTTHYGKSCEFIADQTHCSKNFCQNNSTCYSVKTPREVPNPNVTAVKSCSNEMLKDSRLHLKCNFTLFLKYKCWCRSGYEGSFCEFTEGMRCCAEDLCNNHGLIEYESKEMFNQKIQKDQQVVNCSNVNCTCKCEEHYTDKNCLTISPCRDRECFNAGECKADDATQEAKCNCNSNKFLIDISTDIKISGDSCETIEVPDVLDEKSSKCIPCGYNNSFSEYIKCIQDKLGSSEVEIAKYFATDCIVDGKHVDCSTALASQPGGFCLNSGVCQITVANISNMVGQSLNLDKSLLLIPKCECPVGYEGDFCENQLLDECDWKDLDEHSAFLEEIQSQNNPEEQKVLSKFGQEQFIRTLKNRLFGNTQWKPIYKDENDRYRGFERALHAWGMRTFCGAHGLCRPFNEDEGMECRCDSGYKGTRCELLDPCSSNPCPELTMCVDIPIMDDASEDAKSTFACICDNSQSVDPKTHQCMAKHSEEYKACYEDKEWKKPRCKNSASCYPCKLDTIMMGKAGVKQSTLSLCNKDETKRGYRCLCPPGLEPPICATEVTACDYHRCQNGATCQLNPDNPFDYKCICPLGYGPKTNNTLCQTIIDICLIGASICKKGTCAIDSKLRRGFRCNCYYGYYGLNCEHIEDKGFIAYINENSKWTYPLIVFSALVPIIIFLMAIRDGKISCAPFGRFLQSLWRRIMGKDKGNYKPLEQEEEQEEERKLE